MKTLRAMHKHKEDGDEGWKDFWERREEEEKSASSQQAQKYTKRKTMNNEGEIEEARRARRDGISQHARRQWEQRQKKMIDEKIRNAKA